jgi:hypothetical protein
MVPTSAAELVADDSGVRRRSIAFGQAAASHTTSPGVRFTDQCNVRSTLMEALQALTFRTMPSTPRAIPSFVIVAQLVFGAVVWIGLLISPETLSPRMLFAWGAAVAVLFVGLIFNVAAFLFGPVEMYGGKPWKMAAVVLGNVSVVEAIFANAYYLLSHSSTSAFGGPMSKPERLISRSARRRPQVWVTYIR